LEIAKESTDGSAGVLGDRPPHDRRAIVERHEAMADGRLEGRLVESFGVIVAPAGCADAAGYDGHRNLDDPFICGGTVHAGRAVDDRRQVNLDLGASNGGEDSDAGFEGWNGGLDFVQSVPRMEAPRTGSSACMAKMSFMYNPRNLKVAKQIPLASYARLFGKIKAPVKSRTVTRRSLLRSDANFLLRPERTNNGVQQKASSHHKREVQATSPAHSPTNLSR
jgi:hypothetical protein